MISNTTHMIWFGLKSCLICGSYKTIHHELCDICYEKVLQKINLSRFDFVSADLSIKFPVYSLIEWIPKESDFISKLFLKTKGIQKKKIWIEFSNLFLKEMLLRDWLCNIADKSKIVPCPSKTKHADHAEQWALALAEMMSWTYCPILRWADSSDTRHQREKNLLERWDFKTNQHVKFTVSKNDTCMQDRNDKFAEKHIFVDDVITSGSTAVQAYLALGRPKNFMVIALGKRTVVANSCE